MNLMVMTKETDKDKNKCRGNQGVETKAKRRRRPNRFLNTVANNSNSTVTTINDLSFSKNKSFTVQKTTQKGKKVLLITARLLNMEKHAEKCTVGKLTNEHKWVLKTQVRQKIFFF